MAPAMPFFAEYIFGIVKENNEKESVHLMSWPKVDNRKIDKNLEEKMTEVREIVSLALMGRLTLKINVKQPLKDVKTSIQRLDKKDKEFFDLIKDEINVKEIIIIEEKNNDGSIKTELNQQITEDLKEEGIMREIVRAVQAERKNQNLVPQDKISVELSLSKPEKEIVEKNKEFFMKEFRATEIILKEEGKQKINIKKT
jgi:isoleucyl-tRNA synthetase